MVNRVHGGVITDQTLTGSIRYFEIGKTGIGANAIGDGNHRAAYASVGDAGSGYAVNDVLTLAGTTAGTAATFTVLTVGAGGEVESVALTTDGDMSTIDTNPVATTVAPAGGTLATLNVVYTSNIIIPGATDATGGTGEYYVDYGKPVPGSAADLVLSVISERANIIQIAIVDDDEIQFAVENTGFSWLTIDGSGPSSSRTDPDDMLDAIAALGAAVAVPDETNTGTTIDLTAGVTITEKFFSSGLRV